MGSRKRSETLEQIAMNIFEAMKKIHGLDKRAGLLLRLAALLHDCGKYISLANLGECSYNIIMSTEIIGLSHTEREIVANVVKYNHLEFDYYESMNKGTKSCVLPTTADCPPTPAIPVPTSKATFSSVVMAATTFSTGSFPN